MKFVIFRAIILLSFGLIAFQLFQIQITSGATYQRLAENNRLTLISDEAPRGVIYDRNGAILARNAPAYSVAIIPADLPDDKEQLSKIYKTLAQLLKVPETNADLLVQSNGNGFDSPYSGSNTKSIVQLVADGRGAPYDYVTIKGKVDPDIANTI